MVEVIAFYALYKSRVLIMPCKANDVCLFIGIPDEIWKKLTGIVQMLITPELVQRTLPFLGSFVMICQNRLNE